MKTKFSTLLCIIFLLGISAYSFAQQLILTEKFDEDWTSNPSVHSPAPTVRGWASNVLPTDPRAWHRNDYTTDWANGNLGSPVANGANSTPHYARFHSRDINNNSSALISPQIDMTSHQNEEVFISFYYIDPDGTNDYINLLFSADGTFYFTFVTMPTAASWTKFTTVIPRKYLTAQFRFAFQGFKTNNDTTIDMGIDEVEVYKKIRISSSATLPLCSGGSTDLTATSLGTGTTYTWSPAAGLSSTSGQTVTASPAETTTYTVSASLNGFSHSTAFTVGVSPLPEIEAIEFPTGSSGCNLEYYILNANQPPSNTPYNEDFSTDPSWTIFGQLAYMGGAFSNSNNAGGTMPEGLMYWLSGNVFSDWYMYPNDGNVNNYLPISLENFSTATLEFRHNFDYFSGNYDRNLSVEISTDLSNWNTVWSLRNVTADIAATLVSNINLNNYVNTTIYLRFRYSGDNFGMDNWYFDNIRITGTFPDYTFSPNTGLYTDSGLTTPYTGGIAGTVYAVPDGDVSYSLHSSWGSCNLDYTENFSHHTSRYFANSGNWNVPSNWRPEVIPDISKCVKIPDNKTVTVNIPDAEARSLDISEEGKLTISPDRALTVQDEIIIVNNVASDNLTVLSDANLLQINPVANTGEITLEREARVPFDQYNYWASPVTDQLLYQLYPDIPTNRIMTYNTWDDYFTILPTSTNPTSDFGIGYSIKGSSSMQPDVTATFVGVPQNESTTPSQNTITLATNGNRFNLIGNPYPSNLNLVELYNFGNNSDAFEGSYYFWDNTNNTILNQQGSGYMGNNYAIYNASSGGLAAEGGNTAKIPNGIVKPGQGFLVQAQTGTPKQLEFSNSMRTSDVKINPLDGEAPYYKNNTQDGDREREDKFWLDMVSPGGMHIQILLGYFEEAENSLERFDTKVLNENVSDNLYTLSEDTFKLSIQGRKGPFGTEDVVPLGVKTFSSGLYKIRLVHRRGIFINHQDVYLKDKYLNNIHNLSESDYEFETRSGIFNDRFEILYNPGDYNPAIENQISITQGNGQIIIRANEKINEVSIYNLSGRMIYRNADVNAPNLNIPTHDWTERILFLQLKTAGGEIISEKLILKSGL